MIYQLEQRRLKSVRKSIQDLMPRVWVSADYCFSSSVADLLDQSGLAQTFAQPDSALRPTLQSDGQGRIGIRFQSGQFLESVEKTSGILECHAHVMRNSTPSDFSGVASFKTTNYLLLYSSGTVNLYPTNGSNTNSVNGSRAIATPGNGVRCTIGGWRATSQHEFFRIGTDRSFAGRGFDGWLYELACFDRILGDSDRDLVTRYFSRKWS